MSLTPISARCWRGGAFAAAPAAPTADAAVEVTRQSDLAGWWKFDEESGTNAPDASDTGNDGTLTNMADADWVTGKNGNCLDFDGADDHVVIPADSAYPAGDFSFGCWVKLSSVGDKRVIVMTAKYYTAEFDGNWILRMDGTDGGSPSLRFYAYNGTSAIEGFYESISMDTTNWHHVAFVHNDSASTIQLYFDGSPLGSANSITGGNDLEDASASGLIIGAQLSGVTPIREWAGLIDDVRIYNVAVTDANVAAIYNSGDGDWG